MGPQKFVITKKWLKGICKDQGLYRTPYINDRLYLHYKSIEKLENLEEYTGLLSIWLEGNGLASFEGLQEQKKLKCIFAQENCFSRIEHLEWFPDLVQLNLSSNQIGCIEGLEASTQLHTLNLAHNVLSKKSDLLGLVECEAIHVLDLSNNRIDDIGIVEVLEQLPELRVLNLMGNEVVRKIVNYRRTIVSRCSKLTYLDDRPVFEDERRCIEEWAKYSKPQDAIDAERKMRKLIEEEKQEKHRLNMDALDRIMKGEISLLDMGRKIDVLVDDDEESENEDYAIVDMPMFPSVGEVRTGSPRRSPEGFVDDVTRVSSAMFPEAVGYMDSESDDEVPPSVDRTMISEEISEEDQNEEPTLSEINSSKPPIHTPQLSPRSKHLSLKVVSLMPQFEVISQAVQPIESKSLFGFDVKPQLNLPLRLPHLEDVDVDSSVVSLSESEATHEAIESDPEHPHNRVNSIITSPAFSDIEEEDELAMDHQDPGYQPDERVVSDVDDADVAQKFDSDIYEIDI